MNKAWKEVALGEVLNRSEETIAPEAGAQYQEITVRLWGKGVVLRGNVSGSEIVAQRRFVARTGQFILSRIDARNGALGMVPAELDGALVSNDFPLFFVAQDRLFPAYLGWLCKTASFVEKCQRARVREQRTGFVCKRIDS